MKRQKHTKSEQHAGRAAGARPGGASPANLVWELGLGRFPEVTVAGEQVVFLALADRASGFVLGAHAVPVATTGELVSFVLDTAENPTLAKLPRPKVLVVDDAGVAAALAGPLLAAGIAVEHARCVEVPRALAALRVSLSADGGDRASGGPPAPVGGLVPESPRLLHGDVTVLPPYVLPVDFLGVVAAQRPGTPGVDAALRACEGSSEVTVLPLKCNLDVARRGVAVLGGCDGLRVTRSGEMRELLLTRGGLPEASICFVPSGMADYLAEVVPAGGTLIVALLAGGPRRGLDRIAVREVVSLQALRLSLTP